MAGGDFDGALSAYRLFSEKTAEIRVPAHALASACAEAGNVRIAVAAYRGLLRRYPADYPFYKELEKLYLRSGQPRRALALYEGMAPDNPLRRKGLKRMTGIYWRLGDLSRAVSCLKREIREYGFTARLGRELGKFYLLQKRYVGAIEQFGSALAEDKGDRETRTWLGIALMENENYELAEYEFSELLREKPNDFQALVHIAELRIRQNRLVEARRVLEEMDRRWPGNSRVTLCRAEIEFLEGLVYEVDVALGEQGVAGLGDAGPHAVGLPGQHGPVEAGGVRVALVGGAGVGLPPPQIPDGIGDEIEALGADEPEAVTAEGLGHLLR